jgi:hypothetical protein
MTSQHMKTFAILLCVISFVATKSIAQPYGINKTYSQSFRLYDSTFATLFLRVYGKSWDDSTHLTIIVVYRGKTILLREIKNAFIDKEYFSKEYYSDYPNCNSYVDYKKYYISHLSKSLVSTREEDRYTAAVDSLTIQGVKSDISKKHTKLSRDKIDQLAFKFLDHLHRGRYDRLSIPEGPNMDSEMLVYDPDIKSFIDIDTE